jgi:hypothetical protein
MCYECMNSQLEEARVVDWEEASLDAILSSACLVARLAHLRRHQHTAQQQVSPGAAARVARCVQPGRAKALPPLTMQSPHDLRHVPRVLAAPRMKPGLRVHSPAAAQLGQEGSASVHSSGSKTGSGGPGLASWSGRKGLVWIQKMAAGTQRTQRGWGIEEGPAAALRFSRSGCTPCDGQLISRRSMPRP